MLANMPGFFLNPHYSDLMRCYKKLIHVLSAFQHVAKSALGCSVILMIILLGICIYIKEWQDAKIMGC